MSDLRPSLKRSLKLALELINAGQVDAFCDLNGQPCLRFTDDGREDTVRLRGSRVRSWFATLVWRSEGELLRDSDIDRVLNVLEDVAWRVRRRDATDRELVLTLDREPVLQAIAELMRSRDEFRGRMTALLDELCAVAKRRNIPTSCTRWPKSAAALSLRIKQHHELLRQLGLFVRSIEHTRDGSVVTLVRQRDDVDKRSSLEASPATPDNDSGLERGDNVTAINPDHTLSSSFAD